MNITNFLNASARFWTGYLQAVARAISDGHVEPAKDDSIFLFPQSVLATETEAHLVMELVGARRRFSPLTPQKQRGIQTLDQYFSQFDDSNHSPAGIRFDSHHNGISNLAFRTPDDEDELERRFPGIRDRFLTNLLFDFKDAGYKPLSFSETSSHIFIENCLLVNRRASAVRIRDIRFAVIVAKGCSEHDYLAYLREQFTPGDGQPIHAVQRVEGDEAESTCVAGQFANLYLLNRIQETTIGAFIERHREVLLRALGGRNLISEPHLAWRVRSPDPGETAINPDLFVQRQDGFWDVYDLKLPLLDRVRLTKGERRRRRFIDYVEEGIAQLAHYKEFLSITENRQLAQEKYGVEFETPRYGLIVGNFENVNRAAIDDAFRRLEHFELFDYDTILQLYLASFKKSARVDSFLE